MKIVRLGCTVNNKNGKPKPSESIPCEDWSKLCTLFPGQKTAHATIQWVPGHRNLPGNKTADQVAREAADLCQKEAPVDTKVVLRRVRTAIRDSWRQNLKSKPRSLPPQTGPPLNRLQERLAAQLRTGECPRTKSYLNKISQAEDNLCSNCKVDKDTVEHILVDCDALRSTRSTFFDDDPFTLLSSNPIPVLRFVEKVRPAASIPGNRT